MIIGSSNKKISTAIIVVKHESEFAVKSATLVVFTLKTNYDKQFQGVSRAMWSSVGSNRKRNTRLESLADYFRLKRLFRVDYACFIFCTAAKIAVFR